MWATTSRRGRNLAKQDSRDGGHNRDSVGELLLATRGDRDPSPGIRTRRSGQRTSDKIRKPARLGDAENPRSAAELGQARHSSFPNHLRHTSVGRWKVSSFWTSPWSTAPKAGEEGGRSRGPSDAQPPNLPSGRAGEAPSEEWNALVDRLSASAFMDPPPGAEALLLQSPGFVSQLLEEQADIVRRSAKYAKNLSPETKNMLLDCLRSHFLFADLNLETVDEVIRGMQRKEVAPGDVIMRQGELGNMFYAVETGTFDIYVNDNFVGTLATGSCFGELALLSPDGLRKASVICRVGRKEAPTQTEALERAERVDDASTTGGSNVIWSIAGVHFRAALALNRVRELEDRRNALANVDFFQELTPNQLNLLAQAVTTETFTANERIIEKNTEGFEMYVLMRGTVVCHGFSGPASPASSPRRTGGKAAAGGDEPFEAPALRTARKRLSGNLSTLTLEAGAAFGEQALLYNEFRAAHVDAGPQGAEVLKVSVATFNDLLGPIREVLERNLRIKILSEVRVFSKLPLSVRERLASSMAQVVKNDGDLLFRAGDPAEYAYVIRWGSVKLLRDSATQHETRTKGMCVGEEALMGIANYLDDAQVVCSTARRKSAPLTSPQASPAGMPAPAFHGGDSLEVVELYRLELDDLRDAGFGFDVMENGEDGPKQNVTTLRRLFSELGSSDPDAVPAAPATPAKASPAQPDDDLIRTDCVDFSIDVDIVPNADEARRSRGGGSKAISAAVRKTQSAEVASAEEAKRRRDSGASIDSSAHRRWSEESLRPTLGAYGRRASTTVQVQSRRRTLQENLNAGKASYAADDADGGGYRGSIDEDLDYLVPENPLGDARKNPADFEFLRVLGVGSFGTVKLARHKQTSTVLALKLISKAYVALTRQQAYVAEERLVLMRLRHPFIIRLYDTFQDKNLLYMVMEVAQGGEIFRLMHGDGSEEKLLDPEAAKFYVSCILCVYGYIHEKNIAYRDLKPENILLDNQGYLKIADWGIAKRLGGHKLGVTFTMVGTPEYLAPEIVRGVGHGTPVDFWALGCVLYEMLGGYSPFAGDNVEDTVSVCASIVEGLVKFPGQGESHRFDNMSRDFIKRLLQKDPLKRLGCALGGVADCWRHPWLSGYNVDLVRRKSLQAPWVPPLQSAMDASHFDEYEEEDAENIMLEYNGPDGADQMWAEF